MRNRLLVIAAILIVGDVSHATVTTEDRSQDTTCSGGTSYPYYFPVLSTSHLVVTDYTGSCGSATYTVLALGSTFTATRTATGGTVTVPGTCATGHCLRIQRLVPYTQETSFRSQGTFSPAAHEAAFDKLTMEVQQLADGVAQSPETALAIQNHIASSDDHTMYFKLAGRAGGQTAYGGTLAGQDLTLYPNPISGGSINLHGVVTGDSTWLLGSNLSVGGSLTAAAGQIYGNTTSLSIDTDSSPAGHIYLGGDVLTIDEANGRVAANDTTPGAAAMNATGITAGDAGVIATGYTTGHGVAATGGASSGYGMISAGGAPNGIGVSALGTGTGTAVLATATGNGIGVSAVASGTGHAVVATADTSSPVSSALRLVPQNPAPTACAVGDLYVNSANYDLYACTAATPTWTNFAWLGGRSGGQTLYGSPTSGQGLTLIPNSAATNGTITLGTTATFTAATGGLDLSIGTMTASDLAATDDLTVGDDATITGDLTVNHTSYFTGDIRGSETISGKHPMTDTAVNLSIPASAADCGRIVTNDTDGLTFTLPNITAAYNGCEITFIDHSASNLPAAGSQMTVAIDASDYIVGTCLDSYSKATTSTEADFFTTSSHMGIYLSGPVSQMGDKLTVVADSTNNIWHIMHCIGYWIRIP